jgi:hypothetical protein
MRIRVALMVLVLAALGGCAGRERAGSTPPGPPGPDLDRAQSLLDAGDVPAAVEPLRRAAEAPQGTYALPREEIELLVGQAEAASRPETAEARIAEMKDAVFEAYVERGELPRVPYYHDPRIDAYFRKVLLSKRTEAREIRARRRG